VLCHKRNYCNTIQPLAWAAHCTPIPRRSSLNRNKINIFKEIISLPRKRSDRSLSYAWFINLHTSTHNKSQHLIYTVPISTSRRGVNAYRKDIGVYTAARTLRRPWEVDDSADDRSLEVESQARCLAIAWRSSVHQINQPLCHDYSTIKHSPRVPGHNH